MATNMSISRRDFLVGAIQGVISVFSVSLLLRNERVDRAQTRSISLIAERGMVDRARAYEWHTNLAENVDSVLRVVNYTRDELGLPQFVIRGDSLVLEGEE